MRNRELDCLPNKREVNLDEFLARWQAILGPSLATSLDELVAATVVLVRRLVLYRRLLRGLPEPLAGWVSDHWPECWLPPLPQIEPKEVLPAQVQQAPDANGPQ